METVFEPKRVVCVAKELTKLHERLVSGTLEEVAPDICSRSLKGEFVIAIAPCGFEL